MSKLVYLKHNIGTENSNNQKYFQNFQQKKHPLPALTRVNEQF